MKTQTILLATALILAPESPAFAQDAAASPPRAVNARAVLRRPPLAAPVHIPDRPDTDSASLAGQIPPAQYAPSFADCPFLSETP